MLERGDIVWGKLRSYPWWPAIILDANDCGRDDNRKNMFWLFWFGDHKVSEVASERVLDFEEHFVKNGCKKEKRLRCAIQEVLTVYAHRHKVMHANPSSLFQWAAEGFKKIQMESHVKDIPELVQRALMSNDFQRSYESDSNTEDENVIGDVRIGLRKLEDICISCCKNNCQIVMKHPVFVGSVCQNCKKNVKRVCKRPFGQMLDACLVCGQGGTLVYCSSNLCLRSYCKMCIDYMAPKGAYTKIVNNNKWLCYFCEENSDIHCQIRRRCKYEVKEASPPPLPDKKTLLCVISLNDAALSVLQEKMILVEKYYIEPAKNMNSLHHTEYSKHYEDFSAKEMAEIGADLVCGSFFVPHDLLVDKKKCIEAFSLRFYRFLFRLNNARLYKSCVFFVFISEAAVFDEEVFSHVIRFLEVDPVPVKLERKMYSVWSNIPNGCSRKVQSLTGQCDNNSIAEKLILAKFILPLRSYFRHSYEI